MHTAMASGRKSDACWTISFVLIGFIANTTHSLSALKFQQHNSQHGHHTPRVDRVDPEVFMNVTQLITSKGYPCEEHDVVTEDGFILGVQRIPHGRKGAFKARDNDRPVILLVHGLLSCSACWVENLANESLGFILADAGIDVWLANVRGNTYSKRHKTLSPKHDAFWAWSWDEMAKYDLPAMINYITNATKKQQIYYAGHSQGTEIAFAEFSRNPELGKRIKTFFALAPVTNVTYIKSPIRKLAPIAKEFEILADLLGKDEFLPSNEITRFLSDEVCDRKVVDLVCENIMFLLGGFDVKNLNISRIPVYVGHNPAGTSVQNVVHYAQAVRDGKYQMYDYGTARANLEHYNQSTPPVYDVTKMETPVALFTGPNDWLADPKDVESLVPQLKNVVFNKNILHWEHLDFIWAIDAPEECYSDILRIIKKTEAIR